MLAVAMLAHGAAHAHGPTRQKVSESVEIDAPPAAVWAVAGDFQSADTWLPMVDSSTGEGGNEEGATRTLVVGGGAGEVNEVLKRYDGERMILSYRIPQATHDVNVLPVSNYSSTLSVRANDAGGSTVTWRGAFYRGFMNNDPPENLNDEAAVKAVSGLYQAGLAGLKEYVESQR
ncbi:MAG: SRPBCC family protein [Pseudomonadota bacterium]